MDYVISVLQSTLDAERDALRGGTECLEVLEPQGPSRDLEACQISVALAQERIPQLETALALLTPYDAKK